ncbi:MAG: methylated-DNA--[protein]-cysteine S-methyltransferase [Kiloniellaceae bacterium]
MADPALAYTYMATPIGRLLLAGTEEALHYLSFPSGHKAFGPKQGWQHSEMPFEEAKRQLADYFAGKRRSFDLPLVLTGTAFQKRVWNALRSIPFGETRSYGWLAAEIDRPTASRAVGAANGANPIPVIVPCHRVIGSNGALTGFGGGIETKQFLLGHEGVSVL